jgi:hypothetical protein
MNKNMLKKGVVSEDPTPQPHPHSKPGENSETQMRPIVKPKDDPTPQPHPHLEPADDPTPQPHPHQKKDKS